MREREIENKFYLEERERERPLARLGLAWFCLAWLGLAWLGLAKEGERLGPLCLLYLEERYKFGVLYSL